jgi:ABC-type bacteriocin/lantibiotic exporter with double-glycine peptidase domain
VVWSVPNRSLSSGFLGCLVALAGCLLLIEASGRLWWRFCAPGAWQRSADAKGRLQQSSGFTCSPAAVMLLHRHGIPSSEGEMAYLAGTSLFGTDALATTRALQRKARPHGWQARVVHADYEACAGLEAPFLAHVSGPALGHALLVERAGPDLVEVLDPLDGSRRKMSRAGFERVWDGTAIYLVRAGE